jgi:putative transposase
MRLKRYYGAQHLHFITCSCYHRQRWLGSVRRRDLFLRVLEQVRKRYGLVVVGYVVMPEHIHLLISETAEERPLAGDASRQAGLCAAGAAQPDEAAAQRPAGVFFDTPEHAWQHRFYDFNVWSERKRVEKLRYMHRNPVKRGLVMEPDRWPWSSFRSYYYGEPGVVRINQWSDLKMKIRKVA